MSNSQFELASQAVQHCAPQALMRGSSGWLQLLGAGLGLLAVSAGVAGCSRPAASSEAAKPAYSDQQVADAKKAVCEAYAKGWHSIQVAGSKKKPDDPSDTLPVVAVNGRVSEVAVANYLFNTLRANPAAPQELGDLVSQLGAVYQDIVITQLGDGSREEVHSIAVKADELIPKINAICNF